MKQNYITDKDVLNLGRGPLSKNKAAEVASNIVGTSSANPQEPKAITDIGSGSGTPVPEGNGIVGNAEPKKEVPTSSVNAIKTGADKPVTGYGYGYGYGRNPIIAGGLNSSVLNANVTNDTPVAASEPEEPKVNTSEEAAERIVNSPEVQIGQYLTSKGISIKYDDLSGSLYASGYKLPVTRVDGDIPYGNKSEIDAIINNITSGGDPDDVVAVHEYVGDNGFFSYDPVSGKAFVNGMQVPGATVENGRVYAKRSDLDNILPAVVPKSEDVKETAVPAEPSYPSDEGLVGIRSYLSSYGDDADIQWDGERGKVYVNGVNIPIVYTADGRAYAKKDDVDGVINSTIKANPRSRYNLVNNILSSQEDMKDYMDEVRNAEAFSYDYRNDPSFKAYSDYYDELADGAMREAISAAVARTGGYMNSNALAAANIIRNQYDQQKANIIPQLEQQAFERWDANRQHLLSGLEKSGQIINNQNQLFADIYGNILSADTSRYNTDVQKEIADDDRAASTDIANKEFDLNWAKATNDVALEKERIALERDMHEDNMALQSAELLKGPDLNYDGHVSDVELGQYYTFIVQSPYSLEKKREILQTINKLYGKNFYLLGDEPYEVEPVSETPADTAINNIVGGYGYPYTSGAQANAYVPDFFKNPYLPDSPAVGNAVGNIIYGGSSAPASSVYSWGTPGNTIEANPTGEGAPTKSSVKAEERNSNTNKNTTNSNYSGSSSSGSGKNTSSSVSSGNGNYKYTAKTSDGVVMTWR